MIVAHFPPLVLVIHLLKLGSRLECFWLHKRISASPITLRITQKFHLKIALLNVLKHFVVRYAQALSLDSRNLLLLSHILVGVRILFTID